MVKLLVDWMVDQWDFWTGDLLVEMKVELTAEALVSPSALHWVDYLDDQKVV